jgi:hypothetical protein
MENPLVIQPKAYAVVVHNPLELLKPLTYFSTLIRLVTGSYWNHTANLFVDADKQIYVSEATGKGVTMQPLYRWFNSNPNRKFAIVKGLEYDNPKKIKSYLGIKYDLRIVWQFSLWLLARKWFGSDSNITKWFENENNPTKLFCSEYTAECIGLHKPYTRSPKDISNMGELIHIKTIHDIYLLVS